MGPIEIVFLVCWMLFGIIGLIRGVWRELGATTMLLIVLLILQMLAFGPFADQWEKAIGMVVGSSASTKTVSALLACGAMLLVAFISYQGETLTFPGKGSNWFFSLGTGLLNGYLLAGSIWYYLNAAGWPGGLIHTPYTQFYQTIVKLLPPAVLPWQLLIFLVVFMMIMRVLK